MHFTLSHTPTMCNPNTTASISSPATATKSNAYFNQLPPPPQPPAKTKGPEERSTTPTSREVTSEIKSLFLLATPIAANALILYLRSAVSMFFLGRLGEAQLAGGAAAVAFANITGYSVLAGLALGMEPLCSQAYGANSTRLLTLTLHRTVILLLAASLPISTLWLSVEKLLLVLRQDPTIARYARTYIVFSLPDLLTNSFLHPIRIYLRAQGVTRPVTIASLAATVLHVPVSLVLVTKLRCGVAGVAAASAAGNSLALFALVLYLWAFGLHAPLASSPTPSLLECLAGGWKPLVKLTIPSCASVCLEWWWYEILILLCGLLTDPQSTVASVGILIQTTSLIYIFPSSLGFAASTRVGNELGANRASRAKLSATVSVVSSFLVGLSSLGFAGATRDSWGRIFSRDADILRLTSAALPIIGLCELGNAPQTVGCGILRGTARPSTAARVNLGAFYLVGMPMAIGLGFGTEFGFLGLWMGLLSAQACCAALMLYAVATTDWDAQAEKARVLTSTGRDTTEPLLLNHAEEDGGGDKQPLLCSV